MRGVDNPDALRLGMLYCETGSMHIIERPLGKILHAIARGPELDMLLAPEWFFVAKKKTFYNTQEYASIKRKLEQATTGLEMLLIPGSIARLDEEGCYRNTCPVISDGKTILEYSKRKDGGDEWFGEKSNPPRPWKAGEDEGVFGWREYAAGIEICADHGELRKRGKQSPLDLQFVVASGMGLHRSDLCVREGGIALLCDGCMPKHDIQYVLEPTPIPLAGQRHISFSLGDKVELRVYKVPAPRSVAEPAALERWLD